MPCSRHVRRLIMRWTSSLGLVLAAILLFAISFLRDRWKLTSSAAVLYFEETPLTSKCSAFPKILHRTWKTKKLRNKFKPWFDTFLSNHPTWEHRLWTDEENRDLVKNEYPWFLETYDGFREAIQRADVIRALYMHRFGGVYYDLDFYSLKPLDQLLECRTGVIVAQMGADRRFKHNIPNAFMASEPGQPFWLYFLMEIEHMYWKHPNTIVEETTGPGVLYKALHKWQALAKHSQLPHNITVLDERHVYINDWHASSNWYNTTEEPRTYCTPKHFQPAKCAETHPEAYSVTFWTHSWWQ